MRPTGTDSTDPATSDPFSPAEITRLRAETPGCEHRVHLNNAGAALMPRSVVRAILDHIELEAQRGGYEAAAMRVDAVQQSYVAVAALVGAAPRNIAFAENATAAYAQALSAVPFEPGDTIVTTQDDYVSNQLMFLSLAKRLGVRIVRAPVAPEGGVDVLGLERLVERERPRLVAVTHVPTNSGLVQQVRAVGQICQSYEVLYLVDACQSVGQLPVEVSDLGCDFLSATGRKFLRGPRGSGFLYVSDRVLEAGLAPLFIDLQGARWTGPDHYELHPGAARFENWEFAYALVLGAGEAARYARGVGIQRIATRIARLSNALRTAFGRAGLRVLDRGSLPCGIVTVEVPGWDAAKFHAALEDRGVNTSVSTPAFAVIDFAEKRVDWALRISPHYYNTDEEIAVAAAAIVDLARAGTTRTT